MALNILKLSRLIDRTKMAEAELASWESMAASRAEMNAPSYDQTLGDSTRAAADARIQESYDRLVAFADWCDTLGDPQATEAAVYIRAQLGI